MAEKYSLSDRTLAMLEEEYQCVLEKIDMKLHEIMETNDIQAVSHISNSFYFPVYKTSHFCSFLLIWIFHKERRHYIFKFEAILEASCE